MQPTKKARRGIILVTYPIHKSLINGLDHARIRFNVVQRPQTPKVVVYDKGDPTPFGRGKLKNRTIYVDTHITEEEFYQEVKEQLSERFDCLPEEITLKWLNKGDIFFAF